MSITEPYHAVPCTNPFDLSKPLPPLPEDVEKRMDKERESGEEEDIDEPIDYYEHFAGKKTNATTDRPADRSAMSSTWVSNDADQDVIIYWLPPVDGVFENGFGGVVHPGDKKGRRMNLDGEHKVCVNYCGTGDSERLQIMPPLEIVENGRDILGPTRLQRRLFVELECAAKTNTVSCVNAKSPKLAGASSLLTVSSIVENRTGPDAEWTIVIRDNPLNWEKEAEEEYQRQKRARLRATPPPLDPDAPPPCRQHVPFLPEGWTGWTEDKIAKLRAPFRKEFRPGWVHDEELHTQESEDDKHFVLGVLVLASFMFALIGTKRFRNCKIGQSQAHFTDKYFGI
eukprot:gnl/MRDRNA2_/MRDRNA2_33617_c0_seq1.p1 gnl/MRDRNA2_/MRDRNA2_33617_c0~~gnl/MRDRNA2_/MRDRNA2_33617_c0_seq1.p1  ORF type:complete len:341 (+),score=64.90 gnl/MRDRNA2_/MRDRNA2_33617_c0_seq1:164-1186(+)